MGAAVAMTLPGVGGRGERGTREGGEVVSGARQNPGVLHTVLRPIIFLTAVEHVVFPTGTVLGGVMCGRSQSCSTDR